MKAAQLKTRLVKRLLELKDELKDRHIYRIAAKCEVSDTTVRNYLSGKVSDLELAEIIIDAAEFELIDAD